MKYIFFALLSLNSYASEIEVVYSSTQLAEKLDYAAIESVESKGNNRYLVKTANCKVLVEVVAEELKISKVTCWPLD
jgi:hypothetical protein